MLTLWTDPNGKTWATLETGLPFPNDHWVSHCPTDALVAEKLALAEKKGIPVRDERTA